MATACAFHMLTQDQCAEVAKPEWWNDEELKVLTCRCTVGEGGEGGAGQWGKANETRASVMNGQFCTWEIGPRSAAELRDAATHFDRAAALHAARR